MELITVAVGAALPRAGTVRVVDVSSVTREAGLTVGESVVLQDEESAEFFAGTVIEAGEHCTFEVGERLTPSAALGAITCLPAATDLLGVEQLAEVVGRIRGSAVPLPKS